MTTPEEAVVERCPNCGAPLKLDTAGDCAWCHAHVHVAPAPVSVAEPTTAEDAARVLFGNPLEDEPNDIMLVQPVSNLLIFLSTTGQQAVVQDFLAHWEHGGAVRPLLQSVRAAGTRVTEAAMAAPGYDEFLDHSALFTAEEWWVIQLAIDLLALLAALQGLDPVQALDDENQVREFRSEYAHGLLKARAPEGGDESALRELRAAVPAVERPSAADGGDPDAGGERARHFWHRHREE